MLARVHVDAAFVLGQSHTVCDDYALAGIDPSGRPWAVVCDGCSSVRHADVGARLLAHAAAATLACTDGPLDLAAIVDRARRSALLIDLPAESLQSTLLWARPRGDGLELGACGDGLLGIRRAGAWQWWQLEHPEGAPAYPAVIVDPEARALHRKKFGSLARIHRFEGGERTSTEPRSSDDPLVLHVDWADADAVLLGSDGLAALHDTARSLDPALDVSLLERHVTSFPSLSGGFVGRRLRRLVKSAEASNLAHPDDLAVAALAWGGTP